MHTYLLLVVALCAIGAKAQCPSGFFDTNGGSGVQSCSPWSSCADDEFESEAPTSLTDRGCRELAELCGDLRGTFGFVIPAVVGLRRLAHTGL